MARELGRRGNSTAERKRKRLECVASATTVWFISTE